MSRTFHLRGVPLSTVVENLTERLRAEGFAPHVEPPVEDGGYRRPDPAVRRLVVLGTPDSDWITVADDTFATTAWAERLSKRFGRPVLYMAGECDHAFFTHAVLYEDGAEVARAEVPRDVVLDDDGRHRIRPVSLARIAPEAKATLEAGVIVDELGGEQNVAAIGKALGIENAMPDPFYLPDGATLLTFRFDKRPEHVDYLPNERDPLGLGSVLGNLDALEGLPPDADPNAILGALLPGFANAIQQGLEAFTTNAFEVCDVREVRVPDGPVRITTYGHDARVGDPTGAGFTASLALSDDDAAPIRGFDVELSGDALAFVDIDRLVVDQEDGGMEAVSAKSVVAEGGTRRFSFPDVVIGGGVAVEQAEASAEPRLPFGEAIRQNMRDRSGMLERMMRARMGVLRIRGGAVPSGAGAGTLAVRVLTSAGTTEAEPISITVEEALRLPKLPPWAKATEQHPTSVEHDVLDYRGKEHVVGWLGFRGPWSDVAPVVTRIAARIASAVGEPFSARVQVDDGDLTFKAPVVVDAKDPKWKKVLPALARAAEVDLHTGELGDERLASILIGHRPRGFVGMPDFGDERIRELDLVPVQVSWSIPAPASREARAKLTEALQDALIEAGAVSATLGGYAGTQQSALQRIHSPPYACLLGTRGLDWKTRWLEAHVRTPAWLVLAPPSAAAKLGTRTKAPRVETQKLAHATLIRSTAADPFVYDADDADAIESFVMAAIGTAEEIPRDP